MLYYRICYRKKPSRLVANYNGDIIEVKTISASELPDGVVPLEVKTTEEAVIIIKELSSEILHRPNSQVESIGLERAAIYDTLIDWVQYGGVFSSGLMRTELRVEYCLALLLFIMALIGYGLVLYVDRPVSGRLDKIIIIFMILLISRTPNPVAIIAASILACLAAKNLSKYKRIIVCIILAVMISGIVRSQSDKISIIDGKISYINPVEFICDTSPDGRKTLSQSTQAFGNDHYAVRYYITRHYGLLEQKYVLLVMDTNTEEHRFLSNTSVKIQGGVYKIK